MCDLYGYIQGKEQLLSKPAEPILTDYAQKARLPARRRSQTQVETQDQGSSQGQTVSPQPDHREVIFTDLTVEGQKSFSMAWIFYQDKTKAYDKQKDLIRKLKEWIGTNVSSHYQKTCCKPTESMTKWYENLQKAAGITKRSEKTNAREKYREALKTPKNEDLNTWTDAWEQAMTIAKDKNVLATTEASVWFEDFLIAVGGILPTWVEAYGINKDPQVDDNTLDYRTVANDLRRVVAQTASRRARLQTGTSEISEGSFNSTLDEDATSRISIKRKRDEQPELGLGESPGKVSCVNEGIQEQTELVLGEFPGKVCRACEGYHLTRRCYYLFQDMAPKKWTPQPHLQKLVEQKLKDDPTLEEEAKRWTKS
jgi:hypothetical protein